MDRSSDTPFCIVVGYDFSDLGNLALAEALGLARLNPRTTLHILGVIDSSHGLGPVAVDGHADFQTAEAAQAAILSAVEERAEVTESADFEFFIHARIGEPAKEILGLAAETGADIIVVGTHGRSGVKRLLMGSVAENVVRHASCPVLVMRPKLLREFDTAGDARFMPEPPCPSCVAKRAQSGGAQWWCDEHARPHVQPHCYSYSSGINPSSGSDWAVFNR